MKDERWEEVVEKIKAAFPEHEHEHETLLDGKGFLDAYIFDGSLGRIKLARTKRPRIVGEKGIGSKRIGADTTIEKVYDENDIVDFVTVYRFDDNVQDWVQLEDDSILGSLT